MFHGKPEDHDERVPGFGAASSFTHRRRARGMRGQRCGRVTAWVGGEAVRLRVVGHWWRATPTPPARAARLTRGHPPPLTRQRHTRHLTGRGCSSRPSRDPQHGGSRGRCVPANTNSARSPRCWRSPTHTSRNRRPSHIAVAPSRRGRGHQVRRIAPAATFEPSAGSMTRVHDRTQGRVRVHGRRALAVAGLDDSLGLRRSGVRVGDPP